MMAKAMPIPKAQPIWKILPKAAIPRGLSAFKVKPAMAAIPGKLSKRQCTSVTWNISRTKAHT